MVVRLLVGSVALVALLLLAGWLYACLLPVLPGLVSAVVAVVVLRWAAGLTGRRY